MYNIVIFFLLYKIIHCYICIYFIYKYIKKMRLLKKQVLLRLVNSYLVDSPQPANISYLWNFGSLLGVCLILQILTGIFLAMHYCPNVDLAFNSVEHMSNYSKAACAFVLNVLIKSWNMLETQKLLTTFDAAASC